MPFSTDSTIDFSTDTGYTLSDATISGGELTISAAFEGTATCQAPGIDTSSWVGINNVTATQSQGVDFLIRYLCSFDGGTTWKRNTFGFWETVSSSAIASAGMSLSQLSSVRDWSIAENSVAFLIGITRASALSTGNISQISVEYLSSGDPLPLSVDGEPSPNETLETDLDIQPDFPITISYQRETSLFESEGNYVTHIASVTSARREFQGSFKGLTSSQKDSVVSFLQSHEEIPFTWESAPLTGGSVAVYSSVEPEVTHSGVGVFDVAFRFTERL